MGRYKASKMCPRPTRHGDISKVRRDLSNLRVHVMRSCSRRNGRFSERPFCYMVLIVSAILQGSEGTKSFAVDDKVVIKYGSNAGKTGRIISCSDRYTLKLDD